MVDNDRIARRRTLTGMAIVAIAAVIVTLYYLIAPSSGLYPRCPFKLLTGLDCPGCGSQRAIHALLHGDVAAAWHFNAMLLIGLPFMGLLVCARALRYRHPRLERTLNSGSVIILLLIVIVLWTIIRNIP
ncbi:MAG: DUF2752 domain-containing protein [Bacteroides sp.]|nr:DUF2752 domain-containing protein [Bacteroides sp.]